MKIIMHTILSGPVCQPESKVPASSLSNTESGHANYLNTIKSGLPVLLSVNSIFL